MWEKKGRRKARAREGTLRIATAATRRVLPLPWLLLRLLLRLLTVHCLLYGGQKVLHGKTLGEKGGARVLTFSSPLP